MTATKKAPTATVVVYKDEGGGWRWRLQLGNRRNFAASGEAFAHRGNAMRAAERVVELISKTRKVTIEETP